MAAPPEQVGLADLVATSVETKESDRVGWTAGYPKAPVRIDRLHLLEVRVGMSRGAARDALERVRILAPRERREILPLLARDPVRHCFAASRISAPGFAGSYLGEVLAIERHGRVTSALLSGANMVPVETDHEARQGFVSYLKSEGRHCASILGPDEEVADLWRMLEPVWGRARDVRRAQPLLEALAEPNVQIDPLVRRVRPSELDLLIPACVSMFTEEIGVSPLIGGAEPIYRRRIAGLVSAGYSFARFDAGEPVFKAEIAAIAGGVCQIQGVWVHRERRGEGLASAGMAAVVDYARRLAPRVTLYVNAHNVAALGAYRNAGFRTVDAYSTVLF